MVFFYDNFNLLEMKSAGLFMEFSKQLQDI